MRSGMIRFVRGAAIAAIYGVAFFGLWYSGVRFFRVPEYVLPAPAAVAISLAAYPGYFLYHFSITFLESVFGAMLGFLLGVSSGLLLRYGGYIGRALHPPIVASQVFPKEALAPIFLIIFGFGVEPKIVISALICFFPVAVSVERGL